MAFAIFSAGYGPDSYAVASQRCPWRILKSAIHSAMSSQIPQIASAFAAAIQNEHLMPEQNRFSSDTSQSPQAS